ncbi:MAG: hypothetical protein CMK89_07660 [Pseudomonadales bacterium]|nr:hypothetical protein [Pseudomonadales bacterium]
MIIGVAVQFKNGQEIRLPKPNRHADCFRVAEEQYHLKPTECVGSHGQGFFTDTGEYLNRKEAMTHVRNVGQELLPDWRDGDINQSEYLMSEDVWRDA